MSRDNVITACNAESGVTVIDFQENKVVVEQAFACLSIVDRHLIIQRAYRERLMVEQWVVKKGRLLTQEEMDKITLRAYDMVPGADEAMGEFMYYYTVFLNRKNIPSL